MQKQFLVKIYDHQGTTFLKTINPKLLMSEVRFTDKINGVQGQCVLELNLPMDNFDEGVSVKLMNIVRIYESDDTFYPLPRLIYSGYISQYTPFFSEGSEGLRLTLLGLGSLLTGAYFKDGTSFSVTKVSTDPAQIMKDIVAHFNSVFGSSLITTTALNMVDVGTNVDYIFIDQKWLEAIRKTFDFGVGGRYWKIDANGELYFKSKPGTATHRFTLGRNVSSGEVVKNAENIVNSVQLRWASSNTDFSDATSQSSYGLREEILTDLQISDSTTANQVGGREIADKKDSKPQARLRINTTYDIESIKVGDTCSVFNTKDGSTIFPTNMLIASITYSPDAVDIELENVESSFGDNLKNAIGALT